MSKSIISSKTSENCGDCPLFREVQDFNIKEEILTLANFYSITLPVEYGDGTLANEKFIDINELEMILTSVLEELDENTENYKYLGNRNNMVKEVKMGV